MRNNLDRRPPPGGRKLLSTKEYGVLTTHNGQRFAGTCYRAANWIALGETRGRGRMDRHREADGSARKLVLVYPLCRDVQQRLRQALPPQYSETDTEANWA